MFSTYRSKKRSLGVAGWLTSLFLSLFAAGALAQSAPTISVSRNPFPMVAGRPYTVTWKTTNAFTVTFDCTSSGRGYVGSGSFRDASGSSTGVADAAWVGNPSRCSWTAYGPYGSTKTSELLLTEAPATITVTRTPNPMVAGRRYEVRWTTTNASSVSFRCTAPGTGFNASSVLTTVNGTAGGEPASDWIGYPSVCIWTATNPSGVATTYTETVATVASEPGEIADMVGRDLAVTYDGVAFVGHVGVSGYDRQEVVEVLNEGDSVIKINSLTNFKGRSRYWGARYYPDLPNRPRIALCNNMTLCDKKGFYPAPYGLRYQAGLWYAVQADYTTTALYRLPEPGYTIPPQPWMPIDTPPIYVRPKRGLFRCDTFVSALWNTEGTVPANELMTLQTPVTLFHHFTPR